MGDSGPRRVPGGGGLWPRRGNHLGHGVLQRHEVEGRQRGPHHRGVAARARTALPATVNGRIEKAVRLVQTDSVALHDDGTATVLSESDGVTPYRVVGKSCACPDYTFQAPQGWRNCENRKLFAK